jgi:formate-nitrite transporter family protein
VFFTAQRTRDFKTVNRGKTDIEHQDVGKIARGAQRRVAVGYCEHIETFALEMVRQELANRRIVLGHENLQSGHASASARGYHLVDTGYKRGVTQREQRGRQQQDQQQEQGDGQAPQESTGNIVQLTEHEEEQVKKRSSLRAAVVFETVRREGETEISRPPLALAFSGLAAGLSMGFSLVGTGILHAYLPPAPSRTLFESFGYTLGFLVVVLGRQQLFTENTLTAILPVLDDEDKPKKLWQMLRLWAIVLTTNLIGAAIFAEVAANTVMFTPEFKKAFLEIGLLVLHPTFAEVLWRGILAGWLIAMMVWLLPAANPQRTWVIIIITWVVGAAGLSHIIAGSVEALYVVAAGQWPWTQYVTDFLVPVFIGNCIGGVGLVALLNYGQVVTESDEEPQGS